MSNKKQYVVVVKGETYERYHAGSRFKRTYRGTDLVKILRRVAEVHSYGVEEDLDVENILKEIEQCNADGCDWIETLTVNGEVKLQDEDTLQMESEEEVL